MQNIELRDYFAGMIIQRLPNLWDRLETEVNATRAYALADAMLAARGLATPPAPQFTDRQYELIRSALYVAAADSPGQSNEYLAIAELIQPET